jgi:hypothetical protein
MGRLPRWARKRLEHGKRILWRPLLKTLGGIYAVLAFMTWFLPAPIHDWVPFAWLRSLPVTTWVIAALGLLLIVSVEGSYRIVQGEYDLVSDIRQIVVGLAGGTVGVTMVAGVRNLGAPTILHGWSLKIVLPSHRVIEGSQLVGWKQLTLGTAGKPEAQVFTKAHDLMEQTIHTPIPTGGQVSGVASFLVQGVDKALITQRGTNVRLTFLDVRGNEHTAEHLMTGQPGDAMAYIPGIGSTQGPE